MAHIQPERGTQRSDSIGKVARIRLSSLDELQLQPGGGGGGFGSIEPTNHIPGSCSRSSVQCNTAIACVASVSAWASGGKKPPTL